MRGEWSKSTRELMLETEGWKRVNYQHLNSEIKFVDYDLGAPVLVKTLYIAIGNVWNLHQYFFSAGGSGCHFWKYVHISSFDMYS